MICRLLIITVIVNSSNEIVVNYLLVIACGIVKPYNKEILNKLDGIILQLIIFVAALTLLDDIDSPSVVTTVYALVLLPLLMFLNQAHAGRRAPGFLKSFRENVGICVCVCPPPGYLKPFT